MIKNYTDLTGRVAVVIGGTSGLGRAIALGLAEAGAAVVATGRRQELVDEMAAAITKLGRESLNHSVNVSDRASIDSLREAVLAASESRRAGERSRPHQANADQGSSRAGVGRYSGYQPDRHSAKLPVAFTNRWPQVATGASSISRR